MKPPTDRTTSINNQFLLRILFVGEGVTAAHILRPLALARTLDSSLYDITFSCDPRYQGVVEGAGFRWLSLSSIQPEAFLNRLNRGRMPYTRTELDAYVADERRLLDVVRPDLVVHDFRITLPIACTLTGVPLVTLANAQWSPYVTLPMALPELPVNRILGTRLMKSAIRTVGPWIFRQHCRVYNDLRLSHGLPSVDSLSAMYTAGDRTLYMDIPDLFGNPELPPHHQFIGPVHGASDAVLPIWWNDLPSDRPMIFVSPGSSGSVNATRTILNALADMKVTVMLATAGRMSDFETSGNIFAAEYIPGMLASARADLIICNGGSGMTYMALDAGRPVLSVPVLLDQYYVAEAVERYGAGGVLRAGWIRERDVQSTVDRMLKTTAFSIHAERLKRTIKTYDAFSVFTGIVRRIAQPNITLDAEMTRDKKITAVSHIIRDFQQTRQISAQLSEKTSRFNVFVASDRETRERAYHLAYQVYRDRGLVSFDPFQMVLSPHDATSHTLTLLAVDSETGEDAATMSIVLDAEGLPSDDIYTDEICKLRLEGRLPVEVTRLAIAEKHRNSRELFVQMTNIISIFSRRVWNATDWVIEVNPRHAKFYERFYLFEQIGDEKECNRVEGAPAVLMRMNLKFQEDVIKEVAGRDSRDKECLFPHSVQSLHALRV